MKLAGLWCALGFTTQVTAATLPVLTVLQSADTLKARRPDHVNNAESRYFPAVFNQDGGSCGSASRICYMFAHELNAFRGADAKELKNIYPSHFTWLLTNSNSGKDGMAIANGVPDATVYGGTTYSRVFGNQDCAQSDFGWMQGYDKWYSAMFNRISHTSFSPYGVDTERGRELVKNWIWNHNGDTDFHVGGIVGIGVASACRQAPIADDPEGLNKSAGVVGMKYVTRWGDGVDHALTIVGYDDRIVFDLDSNNVYGEKDKDEVGAWIIVNSWGNGWANKGFIYCPYKYGFPVRQHEGGAWKPEFYHVRKNYRPLRTLKLRMDYERRSEIKLLAGISTDLNAQEPEVTIEMEHFKFAGDGRWENTKAGVEALTPMLGRWADGIMHSEPMEFGYDLTDLSANFDTRRPLKYFFIIETKPTAFASGNVYECSVLDYEFDRRGIETPLMGEKSKTIFSGGQRTVISAVVQGEPFFAPVNLRATGETLFWDAPQSTHYALKSYIIYKDGTPTDTLSSSTLTYTTPDNSKAYAVAALYSYKAGADSIATVLSARTPEVKAVGEEASEFCALDLQKSGFHIPAIFRTRHDCATIEYWLKPRTWVDWNQSVGGGWGNFLIHANNNGSLTAGWDGDNRIDTRPGLITPGEWYHLAFVVARDTLTVYVNGRAEGTLVSKSRKGLGGFRNFNFSVDKDGSMDGQLAELRIWKEARTAQQINRMMNSRFEKAGLPPTLMAYYKGQVVKHDSTDYWRDFAGGHNVRLARNKHKEVACERTFTVPEEAGVDFLLPNTTLYAGRQFELQAIASPAITNLYWSAPEAGVNNLPLSKVSLNFATPGQHTIKLQGKTADGRTLTAEKRVDVLPVTLDAAFLPTHPVAKAGERISFAPVSPMPGYSYRWTMAGADRKTALTQNAAATYVSAGNYKVKLKVTDLQSGKSRTGSYKLYVKNVAPAIDFDLSSRIVEKGAKVTLTDRSRYAPTKWHWQIDSRRVSMRAEGRNPEILLDAPGVYDVTLTASNAEGTTTRTQKQILTVCNANSQNGLNFSRREASVITGRPLWTDSTDQMTVEWWLNASTQDLTSGMGHSAATWQITANKQGALTFTADSANVNSGNGFILPGNWHHYAVSFNSGKVCFLRDGELIRIAKLQRNKHEIKTLPATPNFRLGGQDTPVNGVIDELRVWQTALADTVLQGYCNAPIANIAEAEKNHKLALYYSFNQNGGDVKDLTSHANNGRRDMFGPDGDAWGLSTGVFCLNFDSPFDDITATTLPPSSAPFTTSGKSVNCKDSARFKAFATGDGTPAWHVENYVETDTIRTGIYVDGNKEDALCIFTGWDNFAGKIENHKLYTTVTLPAGKYELEVISDGNKPSVGISRLVVNEGVGLPDIQNIDKALASGMLADRRLSFILDKPTEVSLGMLFCLSGRSGIAINRIILRRATIK